MRLCHRAQRSGFLMPCTALLLAACAEQTTAPAARNDAPVRVSPAPANITFTGNIRIGVVPSATSITVGSDAPWTIRNKVTGAVLLTAPSGDATVVLESSSTSQTNWRLQIVCTPSVADRDARVALAASRGYATYTQFVPAANCWRVMIGEYPASMTFSQRVTEKDRIVALGHATAAAFWQSVTIIHGVTQYRLTRGSDVAMSNDPVILDAGAELVRINARPYRGVAEVVRNSGGALAGVNELPLDEYLWGVVPLELPPNPYGQLEAQKAQAVAARTYALSGLGKRAIDGYDLLPTTSDQVYGGYAAEKPVSSAAVDATRGVVAAKDGKLISALYSSTTGGWTADNEEVYSSAPVSYLRGVPDQQRGKAFEHVPTNEVFKNSGNPTSLRAERAGSFESDWSRYHRWTFEWTPEEITAVLSVSFGVPVGTVRAINVLERGPSGRVMRIEFVTDAGNFYSTKDAIRSVLKYINASGGQSSLLSTLFFIEPVLAKGTRELAGFRAHGGGWGHGVGMGQTGAAGMAEKGATYEEILKHYYRGIDLVTWY